MNQTPSIKLTFLRQTPCLFVVAIVDAQAPVLMIISREIMNSFVSSNHTMKMFCQRVAPRSFLGLFYPGLPPPLHRSIEHCSTLRYRLLPPSDRHRYFLVVYGTMMMTRLGPQYWNFLLAQGFCIGLGAGCIFSQINNLQLKNIEILEILFL